LFFILKGLAFLAVVTVVSLAFYLLTLPKTYYVYFGPNSKKIKIEFADASLSAKNKKAIVEDLNLCLGESSKRFYPVCPPENGEKKETKRKPMENAYGYWSHLQSHPCFADIWWEINFTPDKERFIFSQKASGIYTNALAFADANKEIVASGYKFAKFVASPDFPNSLTNNLLDYVFSPHYSDEQIMDDASNIILRLTKHRGYFPPSILGFHYTKMRPEFETSNFVIKIPYLYYGLSLKNAIWHDGKWKFYNP